LTSLGSRPLALSEYKSIAFPVYLNRVTWTEIACQNLLGQGIFQLLLDSSSEGTSAIDWIKARLTQMI
jgi:hypothetical protein